MCATTPDHIAEVALIELSRIQRETLTRWAPILVQAGEEELAQEVLETLLKYPEDIRT